MRFKQIDVLRGLAASIVAFFHFTTSAGLSPGLTGYGTYGVLGVQLFFVISGFVLPYSMYKTNYTIANLGTFMLKRIIRIYPAYFVAVIIGISLAYVTGRAMLPGGAIAAHLLFLNYVIAQPAISPVFWTLTIEFQFYILIGLCYALLVKSNTHSVAFLLLLSGISFFFPIQTIFNWFPFFALGVLIFNKHFTGLSNMVFIGAVAVILTIIVFHKNIPQAMAGLFAVAFIMLIKIEKGHLLNKLLLGLGTVSYSLYLIHWDLGRAAINFSRRLPVIAGWDWTRLALGFVFSVICAWLLYYFIERPSLKYSSKIKYRNQA
jgi:peptidoglycan/LPS O-acetylase OafA/YrhL